jgi:uncharacterized peroxidase-related enzyme
MFIAATEPSEPLIRFLESSAHPDGFVMNLIHAWAWRPDVFEGFGALRSQLTSNSTLTKRDQAVIVCATAAGLGDSYCCLAWGRTLSQEAGPAVAAAVIGGVNPEALSSRDLALAAWARKVVANPNGTSASDVQALRDVGFGEREVFEITAFVAFRLAFSTINDALGVNPDWQLPEALAPDVRDAVRFGRPAADRPAAP